MSSTVVTQALDSLRSHLDLDIAYIAELEGDDMIIRAHCAPDLPIELPDQFTIPREAGFCHHMLSGAIPQILTDSSKHDVAAHLPARKEFSIESYIAIPLNREDGSNYGTLCCIGHESNESLNERDLKTLRLFGEIVVGQIDRELEDQRLTHERQARIEGVLSGSNLTTHYQPIVDLVSGETKGFEALSRFPGHPHPTPDQWFHDAAAIGRGVEVELTAVQRALKIMPHLPASCYLGLNASAECIVSNEFQSLLRTAPAEQIVLEITEHSRVSDYSTLINQLAFIRDTGVRLAIDDTGAGHSSLSHVVQLQPDLIKLDMSLTRDVNKDQVRRALANALVFFAKETNAEIIAEGIENANEKDALRHLGVRFGQGYLFAKPMPMDDALSMISHPSMARSA